MPLDPQDVDYDPLERMRYVTFKELDDFYDAMGTEHPCENCNAQEWNHVCDSEGPVALKIPAFNREDAYAVAFVISCKICGNLRQTNGGTIIKWLDDRAEK
ncbi:hypothetical protein D3C76_568970 [compost metagenome]